MSVEYLLVVIFSSLFQAVILHQALKLLAKRSYVNNIIQAFILLAYTIIIIIFTIYIKSLVINTLSSVLIIIIISFMYDIKLIKRMFFPVILSSLFIITELFMGLIITSFTSMSVEQMQTNVYFYMQGLIGSKLLVFFFILVFKQFISSKYIRLSVAINIIMCMLPIAVNVVIFAISELMVDNTNKTLSILMTSGTMAFLLSIILLMYAVEKNIEDRLKKNTLEFANSEMKMQLVSVNSLIEKYKFNTKTMHDMNNVILALRGMSSDNKNFASELDSAEVILNNARSIIYTGVLGLDAILNDKLSKMTALSIKNKIKIIVGDMQIDEMKLSILIGNLLDNAIEESERLISDGNSAYINVDIFHTDNQLHIRVVNNKRKLDNRVGTSKKNKYKHGFGSTIIDNITSELNGVIIRDITENEYIATAMLVI